MLIGSLVYFPFSRYHHTFDLYLVLISLTIITFISQSIIGLQSFFLYSNYLSLPLIKNKFIFCQHDLSQSCFLILLWKWYRMPFLHGTYLGTNVFQIALAITLVIVIRVYTCPLSHYLPYHCSLLHYFRFSLAHLHGFLLYLIPLYLVYLPILIYLLYKTLYILANHLIK